MSPHPSVLTRLLLGSALALLAAACGTDTPEQGELMLSVTTDMAVPNDIDRVVLSVTLDGETTPYKTQTVELAHGEDLPITLAIQAGKRTTAPITVRVEGRKGDAPSLLRVSREARVMVPKHRVAELKLPLSWLCTGANLSEVCEEGSTCQAGHCVAAAVATASLPDFEPSRARDCYDVTACVPGGTLVQVGPITLRSGREVPCGILGTKLLGSDANVNVVLEVTNERVGNYGFCGPYGECYVPLHRAATAEGWHTLENGDTPAIELPPAVCENSTKSITRAVIVRASPSCPSDQGERPLCSPAEQRGCRAAPVCPTTSPEPAWVGYACTDADPRDDRPDLLKCWSPTAPSSDGDTPNDGRWCCLRGQEPSSDPLLIDDMQGGPQIKLTRPEGHVAGWWFADIPDGSGDLSPPQEPSLYTYRQFDEPVGPPNGPKFHTAACLSSTGFRGWQALEGFFLSGTADGYLTDVFDVSQYAGISFWGWAKEPFPNDPLGVSVTFPNVQASDRPGSECITASKGAKRCDSFQKEVALNGEWQRFVVRWEDLAQSEQEWGQARFLFFKPQIYSVYFAVTGAGPDRMSQPFEFCVTDVRFEKKAETEP
jgi:hypothetical protein